MTRWTLFWCTPHKVYLTLLQTQKTYASQSTQVEECSKSCSPLAKEPSWPDKMEGIQISVRTLIYFCSDVFLISVNTPCFYDHENGQKLLIRS